MRRGHVRYFFLARPVDALDDLNRALSEFRRADERVWVARTLNVAGRSHLALGDGRAAARCVREADAIFSSEGQVVESLITLHNRGGIAFCEGDLPLALRLYDEAAERYVALDMEPAALVIDQCEALLAAGLADEAVELVRTRLASDDLPAVGRAELTLRLAGAELAADDPGASLSSAQRALGLFRRQHREFWAVRAELAVLLARRPSAPRTRRLAEHARSVAQRLEAAGPDDAAVAWLVAGQLSVAAQRLDALELLGRAAAYRSHASDLVRATGWQARALEREINGDRRGILAACRRGLDALDEHRATLGSSELRALATRHGDELAALALRHAVHSGPRVLLEWSERWRATALTQPPVHPPDDAELAQSWRRCATPVAASPRHGRRGRRRRAGWTRSGPGWSGRSGGVPTTWRAPRPRPRGSRRRSWSTPSMALLSWSWSTSTACCTHWSPGPAGSPIVVVGPTTRGRAGGRVRPVRAAADGPRTTLGPRRRRASAAGDAAGGRRTPPR